MTDGGMERDHHRWGISLITSLFVVTSLGALGCDGDGGRDPSAPNLGGEEDTDAVASGGLDSDGGPQTEGDDDSGESGSSGELELDELSTYIFDLGHLDIDDWLPKQQTNCQFGCGHNGQEGEQWCEYVHYSETDHAADFVAFQPNSATLWPGNVVQGDDSEHGILTPIGLPRQPMTFSVSLENVDGSPSRTMENPSLSQFREHRNDILKDVVGGAPAYVTFSVNRVHDESQVAVAVGGGVDWFLGGFSSMFDFSNTFESTKILVDFTQAYYTIDVDTPGLPSDFFEEDVSVADLENFTGENNPPMYVQSITYGRKVLFSLESIYSEHEVRTAIDASFNAILVSGGVQVDTFHREVLSNSKMTATVIGGSGAEAVKTITGFDGLVEYIIEGGEYSKLSPGAPIAYKLAYLDNTGVKFAFAADYSERQCYDNFIDVTGEVAEMRYLGGNDDGPAQVQVKGNIQFRIAPPLEPNPCRADAPDWKTIWDRGGDGQNVPGIWIPSQPNKVTVYDHEVDPLKNNQLCIRGSLREDDDCFLFCDDDTFGTQTYGPVTLDNGWAGDHYIEFSDQGTVGVTVRISID